MLTKNERRAKRRSFEETLKIRRTNLALLAGFNGGWMGLSARLGVRFQTLSAMGGINPTRPITERRARDWEEQLRLPHLWFDEPHSIT